MSYRRVSSGGEPIASDVLARPNRRKPIGFCQVMRWMGVMLLIATVYGMYYLVKDVVTALINPYQSLYVGSDADQWMKPVVKPLITNETSFDIEATLWLNVTGFLSHHSDLGERWKDLQVIEYQRGERLVKEAVIYNGIVFKDLRLKSSEHTSVKVQLPAAPFFDDPALGPHLRSSFVIVPRHHMDAPEAATAIQGRSVYPRTMPYSLPRPQAISIQDAGSVFYGPVANATSIDSITQALDLASAGATQFFYRRGRLLDTKNATRSANASHPVVQVEYGNLTMSSNVEVWEPVDAFDSSIKIVNGTTYICEAARSISTRTRLAIVPRTPVLDGKSFENEQIQTAQRLATCFRRHSNDSFPPCQILDQRMEKQPGLDQLFFFNTVSFNGSTTHGTGRGDLPVSRYLPPLAAVETSAIPKYRKMLPDFYTEEAEALLQADVIEYEWELYISSNVNLMKYFDQGGLRNPVVYQDRFPLRDREAKGHPTNATKDQVDDGNPYMAFSGDRLHPQSKPWRHGVSDALEGLWGIARNVVILSYWASTVTTTGISIPSMLLMSGAWLFVWSWRLIVEFIRLRLVLRISVSRWRLAAGLFVLYYTEIFRKVVLRPVLGDGMHEVVADAAVTGIDWKRIVSTLSLALNHSSRIGQSWFNAQTGTFAGFSKVAVVLDWVHIVVLNLALRHVHTLSGHMMYRDELTLAGLVYPTILTVQAAQALLLPSVPQEQVDEDEE
ncbi:hypothetical protein OC835_004768 [Tilletia horrida]|nr:hypothetical protein OC835_004768 [Tilletia horrida]KAK0560384.1 hypothetical protein OC844_003798 [Tilletia horrida]